MGSAFLKALDSFPLSCGARDSSNVNAPGMKQKQEATMLDQKAGMIKAVISGRKQSEPSFASGNKMHRCPIMDSFAPRHV